MRWQDIKLLLFLALVALILFLWFLLASVPARVSQKNGCTKPIKIGGALVIGEEPCDEKRASTTK